MRTLILSFFLSLRIVNSIQKYKRFNDMTKVIRQMAYDSRRKMVDRKQFSSVRLSVTVRNIPKSSNISIFQRKKKIVKITSDFIHLTIHGTLAQYPRPLPAPFLLLF